MNKIYVEDNYIILELSDGTILPFNKGSIYDESTDSFVIEDSVSGKVHTIAFSNADQWENKEGTETFNVNTLRTLFRKYSGFNSASGGSGATSLSEGQVPKADVDGLLVYGGATVDPTTGEWTFDQSINVPQASVNVSDTLKISEATFKVFVRDNVAGSNSVNASTVIDDSGSSNLSLLSAVSKQNVIAQPDFGTEFTTNPLTVPLLATFSNQTDAVTIKTGAPMTNVRMTITDNESGVVVKYIPNKSAVTSGEGGLNLRAGDNRIDLNNNHEDDPANGLFYLGFTPLRQFAGQASTLHIEADNVSILGEPGGIPFFMNEIQFLYRQIVPFTEDVSNIADSYVRINDEHQSTTGASSGTVFTYKAETKSDTVTDGQFAEGFDGASNPMVLTDSLDTFSQNDIIQITGTKLNDGLYEVEDHTGSILMIRGVGTIGRVEDFTKDNFLTTVDSATITKVNICVLRSSDNGVLQVGKGCVTPLSFTPLSGGSFNDTDDLPEGVINLYYTEARVSANASVQANSAKVSFPEAPVDGNQYARKDAGWEQVASTPTDISCKLTNTTDQMISHNSLQMITWDTEEYDTDNMHTSGSVITIKTAGKYQVTAQSCWDDNSDDSRFMAIFVNGGRVATCRRLADGPSEDSVSYFGIFAVNDTIQLQVYQDSGGTRTFANASGTTKPYLEAHKIN